MKRMRGFLVTLALGCPACGPTGKSGDVAAAMREYVPQITLDNTLGAVRLKLPSLTLRAGESANFADTAFNAPDGFGVLVLRLSLPSYDAEPSPSEQVRRIELWATRDSNAASRAYQRLATHIRSFPDTTCVLSATGRLDTRAVYWTDREGGVVLETPVKPRPWQARLVFFRGGWNPIESIGATRTAPC